MRKSYSKGCGSALWIPSLLYLLFPLSSLLADPRGPSLQKITLVPVILPGKPEPVVDRALLGALSDYWYWSSAGRFVPEFIRGEGIYWETGSPEIPMEPEHFLPVVHLLKHPMTQTGVSAYVLLFPYGALRGAGFFIPPSYLESKGLPSLYLMGADRPQAILHEIGHALGLKDLYPKNEVNPRPFTLMGWAEDLIPPLDPVARTALGWSRIVAIPSHGNLSSIRMSPEDVVNIRLSSGGSLWFALQPLINLAGVEGWMVELDYLPQGESWQRVQMSLMGPREEKEATFSFTSHEERVDLHWSFTPTPPRVQLLIERKGIRSSAFGCSLSSNPPRGWDPGEGIARFMVILLFLLGGSILLRRGR